MTIALPRLDRSNAADRGLTLADFLVPITVAERVDTRARHVVLQRIELLDLGLGPVLADVVDEQRSKIVVVVDDQDTHATA